MPGLQKVYWAMLWIFKVLVPLSFASSSGAEAQETFYTRQLDRQNRERLTQAQGGHAKQSRELYLRNQNLQRVMDIDLTPILRGSKFPAAVWVLELRVSQTCLGLARGTAGLVDLGDRRIRFFIPGGKNETSLILGHDVPFVQQKATLYFHNQESLGACRWTDFNAELVERALGPRSAETASADEVRDLALAHAPAIHIRDDLYFSHFDDVPLVMGYSWMPRPNGGHTLRYTVVFSDQNAGKLSAKDLEKQTAVWSRRTDIEWVYEISFTADGSIIFEEDQPATSPGGRILQHLGLNIAGSRAFMGKPLPSSTAQPLIYIGSNQHSFSPVPSPRAETFGLEYFHLVPSQEVPYPEPREELQFQNPWIFEVNDRELAERGFPQFKSDHALYVKVRGTHHYGAFSPHLRLFLYNNEFFRDYFIYDDLRMKHLGRGLWGESSYAVIPLTPQELQYVESFPDRVQFRVAKPSELSHLELNINNLSFFKLVRSDFGFEVIPLPALDLSRTHLVTTFTEGATSSLRPQNSWNR